MKPDRYDPNTTKLLPHEYVGRYRSAQALLVSIVLGMASGTTSGTPAGILLGLCIVIGILAFVWTIVSLPDTNREWNNVRDGLIRSRPVRFRKHRVVAQPDGEHVYVTIYKRNGGRFDCPHVVRGTFHAETGTEDVHAFIEQHTGTSETSHSDDAIALAAAINRR